MRAAAFLPNESTNDAGSGGFVRNRVDKAGYSVGLVGWVEVVQDGKKHKHRRTDSPGNLLRIKWGDENESRKLPKLDLGGCSAELLMV